MRIGAVLALVVSLALPAVAGAQSFPDTARPAQDEYGSSGGVTDGGDTQGEDVSGGEEGAGTEGASGSGEDPVSVSAADDSGNSNAGDRQGLAFTGMPVALLVAVGLALVSIGLALALMVRTRMSVVSRSSSP